MKELELISTLLWMIGGLLSALVAVIAWIGGRIHARLDAMSTSISAIQLDLHARVSVVEKDYHGLERRVEKVETNCSKQACAREH